MKAVGYRQPLPLDHDDALLDLELPAPVPGAHDLLVRVRAVSVNPLDVRLRKTMAPKPGQPGQAGILGFDAVGVVEAVGASASLFKPGDRVFYAGSIARPGTNAELHAVDERIAGPAPATLSDADAAALPLTSITAWELLFDRLGVPRGGGDGQTLLITGGAGGVGSMLIQLARRLTGQRVVATASRPETRQWCLEMGAHDVIDHSQPLAPQLAAIGITQVDRVASLTHTGTHFESLIACLKPFGQFALIDNPPSLDALKLRPKALSLHWELMFTRPLFNTPDMAGQGRLLAEVAALVDTGHLRTTAGEDFGPLNAANLRRAHAWVESGRAVGKAVLGGF